MYLSLYQIAGGDDHWSCVGDNVLDVLQEMEKEHEKKEKVVNEFFSFLFCEFHISYNSNDHFVILP